MSFQEDICDRSLVPVCINELLPTEDMKRVEAYINDVARYMEVDPRELVCKILMEWAYSRSFNGRP